MKNIKFFSIMTAIASMVIVSNSKAKLSGAYVGVNYVNAYDDSIVNNIFEGKSAVGNISTNIVGGGVEVGYNYNIDNILIGGGLSYIYAALNHAYVSNDKKIEAALINQGISGNRINLDINAGYVFEDKVALTLGGIISYNPGKMTWFATTKEYRDFVEKSRSADPNKEDFIKVSKLSRVDKMLTFGIRFNF